MGGRVPRNPFTAKRPARASLPSTPAPGGLVIEPSFDQPHVEPRSIPDAFAFLGGVDYDLPDDTIHWYHTIDLPDGTRTPGLFDHRELLPHYGLPTDMTGRTAIDVATYDGYWAFEMEKRGAVVSALDIAAADQLDIPFPARATMAGRTHQPIGIGFEAAHTALGSSVKKIKANVYDLDPSVHGTFDFVHMADLLLHLRRPLDALAAVRSITGTEALIVDAFDPALARGAIGAPTQYVGGWDGVLWWLPSYDALAQMIVDAGFTSVHVNLVYALSKVHETAALWRASITAKT